MTVLIVGLVLALLVVAVVTVRERRRPEPPRVAVLESREPREAVREAMRRR